MAAESLWEFPDERVLVEKLGPHYATAYPSNEFQMAVVAETFLVVYRVRPGLSLEIMKTVALNGVPTAAQFDKLQKFIEQEARIFDAKVCLDS